jgi:hypothetical protein
MDTDTEVLEKPAKQRQRQQQQQQQVVKTEPGVLVVRNAAGDAGVGVGDAVEDAVGVRSSSSRVLEVCVEPPGGGTWAVTHLQLSQVSVMLGIGYVALFYKIGQHIGVIVASSGELCRLMGAGGVLKLELCVEPLAGGALAVTHLQLSQVT